MDLGRQDPVDAIMEELSTGRMARTTACEDDVEAQRQRPRLLLLSMEAEGGGEETWAEERQGRRRWWRRRRGGCGREGGGDRKSVV